MKLNLKTDAMRCFYCFLLLCFFLTGCRNIGDGFHGDDFVFRSIYHWKMVFQPSKEEKVLMERHRINRLYLRFFDVSVNPETGEAMPIATTVFRSKTDEAYEVVPVVFITLEGLKQMMASDLGIYAGKIVTRVCQMVRVNGVRNVREVQVDCDWTVSTEKGYFELLKAMRRLLKREEWRISATIRFWQLRREVPPVDRGVLMCYNTGEVLNSATNNSIVDLKDVQPYLKDLPSYALPLDVAYPTFGWTVWFRDSQFKALLRGMDWSDTTLYRQEKKNTYQVLKDHFIVGKCLQAGDILRCEVSDYAAVRAVKQAVEERLRERSESFTRERSAEVVLYHWDESNLKKYADYEIDSLYMR